MTSTRNLAMAHIAVIGMLFISLLGAGALVWKGSEAVTVQDAHVRTDLAQGIQLLRDSARLSDHPQYTRAVAFCTVESLECAVNKLNRRLWDSGAGASRLQIQLALDLPPERTMVTRRAALWLLQATTDHPQNIGALLSRTEAQLASLLGQRDPFRLPGCLLRLGADGDGCLGKPFSPPSIPDAQALDAALANWRLPLRDQSPNRAAILVAESELAGTTLAQGRHVWLSLEPHAQALAQTTVACYVGDQTACAKCPWCNVEEATTMFEAARARMMGVLLLDTASGEINALASAHTACFREMALAQPNSDGCPEYPARSHHARPWTLNNHALYATYMPGSLIKPVLAAGLLRAGLSGRERARMADYLVRSDTEGFIDLVLCKEQGFDKKCIEQRVRSIASVASDMGWDVGVSASLPARRSSATQDVLTGRQLDLQHHVPGGVLLTDGSGRSLVDKLSMLNVDAIRACYRGGSDNRWRGCQGSKELVQLIAELYGQGNASASPIIIARSWQHLVAAAQGKTTLFLPHLVAATNLAGTSPRPVVPTAHTALAAHDARFILDALGQAHIRGTSHSSCVAAAKHVTALACNNAAAPVRISGKTGTPLFPADQLTLDQWQSQCRPIEQAWERLADKSVAPASLRHAWHRCRVAPLKWYVGHIARSGDSVIVVAVAERNFNRFTGRVDAVLDRGSNVAAEVALAIGATTVHE